MTASPIIMFSQVQPVAERSSSGSTRGWPRHGCSHEQFPLQYCDIGGGAAKSREGVSMSAEARLKELGIVLPSVPTPVANYVPFRLAGNLLFLSGQGPRDEKGATLTGKVGK